MSVIPAYRLFLFIVFPLYDKVIHVQKNVANKVSHCKRTETQMKKRVLHITSCMFPAVSGTGQVAYDIASSLSRELYEQLIICFNTADYTDVHYARNTKTVHEHLGDIPIIRCGVSTCIASQPISLSYPKELKAALNEFRPDIVFFHAPCPFLAEFLLPFIRKGTFRFVLFWHSDIVKQKVLGKLFNHQNEQLLKYADKVIATSPNYIDGSAFLRKHREKCVVIPCCIRDDEKTSTPEVDELVNGIKSEYRNKIICFALGRHVHYKGFEYLIDSCRYLDDNYAVFIGSEGPLTDKLKEMAKNDPKIHFTGHLSSEELQAYYMACDVFCFPSITKNEAFGLALADALYYGKPAVTYKIEESGVNYVNLDNITGIECPNRDSRAFAQAITRLGQNPELRRQYGENGRKRATELFLFSRFQENINRMIDELVDTKFCHATDTSTMVGNRTPEGSTAP